MRAIARVHERPENVAFHRDIGGALENVEQCLPAFDASERAEMLHGASLEIRIPTASDLDDDLTRFGRSVLRENIQRTLFEAWRPRAVDDFLEHRNRALFVGAREAVERHQPQFFVRHVLGAHRLPGRLPDLDFQRARFGHPAAFGKRLSHPSQPFECCSAVALLVLRPGNPVHRPVGARAVLIHDLREELNRLVPAAVVERARSVLIVAILVVVDANRDCAPASDQERASDPARIRTPDSP